MKRIAIFGATGSIGRAAVEIVRANSDRLEITALAAGSDIDGLLELARSVGARRVAVAHGESGEADGIEILSGVEGLRRLAMGEDSDLVLNAIVGAAGLPVTLAAIESGKDLALANKESLVMAGELVMALVRENGARLTPIDSEHSALFRCLMGHGKDEVKRLILTASGGPFRERGAGAFDGITRAEALAHPTWSMGEKITIDSATLMNKGLEVIEAHHLFGVSPERIEVMVHPQSVVHSMIELSDGSLIAQMGPADMKVPIQFALLHPDRPGNFSNPPDLAGLPPLTFEEPRWDDFPCLGMAYRAIREGGTTPAVMNAANETAVAAFLREEISFPEIALTIEKVMDGSERRPIRSPDDVFEADTGARRLAEKIIGTGR